MEADGVKGAQIISLGRGRRGGRGGGGGGGNGSSANATTGMMLRVGAEADMAKLEAAVAAEAGDFALRSTPDSPSATVKVVEGYIGVVIGRGGSEISRVEGDFGVSIDVIKSTSSVVIAGESIEGVNGARDDILARLRRTVKLDVTVQARRIQVRARVLEDAVICARHTRTGTPAHTHATACSWWEDLLRVHTGLVSHLVMCTLRCIPARYPVHEICDPVSLRRFRRASACAWFSWNACWAPIWSPPSGDCSRCAVARGR